ncbi:MAG TPA: hypothetical protein VK737_03750 [Opitutales bacterium]|jgi:hypothetical protein|nr:hypothetical protein [Opitutales bacterium]
MKNYYDKVLFLLGLIVLGIGVGIFYQKGAVPKAESVTQPKLRGTPYEDIPEPDTHTSVRVWETPPDQNEIRGEADPGWIYQVFTPPKIYWETGTGWIPQSPDTPPKVPAGFGLTFVAPGQDLYRIQIQGVSGTGQKDDVINFWDVETNNDFHLKVGEVNDDSKREEIQVVDLSFEKRENHGIVSNTAVVTILDQRTNQQVKLTEGELYSPTGTRYITLHFSDPFPEKDWNVSKEGDEIEFPGSTPGFDLADPIVFHVDNIDFDAPSVTVERQIKNKRHVLIKPVLVQTLTPPTTETAAPAADTSTTKSKPPGSPGPTRPSPQSHPAASSASATATGPKRDTSITANSIGHTAPTTPTAAPSAASGTNYKK